MLAKLAVDVVREVVEESGTARGDTSAVRVVLRIMLPHCPERWPLTMFWESPGQNYGIGREQGMNAAYNGILVQLARAGALPPGASK